MDLVDDGEAVGLELAGGHGPCPDFHRFDLHGLDLRGLRLRLYRRFRQIMTMVILPWS